MEDAASLKLSLGKLKESAVRKNAAVKSRRKISREFPGSSVARTP